MRTFVLLVLCVLAVCAPVLAQTVELGNVFRDAQLGYSLRYPTDWIYQKPSPYTVVFSGPQGTAAYYSTVALQDIASTRIGGTFDSAQAVVNDLKCQLATGSDDVHLYNSWPLTWVLASGEKLVGSEFTVEFTRQNERFKMWQVVLPLRGGDVFCSWSYTSPSDQFDTFFGIARAMFDSWAFLEQPPTGGTTGDSGGVSPSGIATLFQARDHIYRVASSEAEFSLGKQDKRTYTITVPSSGYLSCAVVSVQGQWIGCSVYDSAGNKVGGRAGNQGSIYGGIYPIAPGAYTVVVGPMKATDDSQFELSVYFAITAFTLDDLIAAFGDQYRRLE